MIVQGAVLTINCDGVGYTDLGVKIAQGNTVASDGITQIYGVCAYDASFSIFVAVDAGT